MAVSIPKKMPGSSILACPYTWILLASLGAGLRAFPEESGPFPPNAPQWYSQALDWFDSTIIPPLAKLGLDVEANYDRLLFTIGSVLVLETIFCGLNAVLALCYKYDWFAKYRIDGAKYPDKELVQECLVDLVIGHLIVRPLILYFAYPALKSAIPVGLSRIPAEIPGFRSWCAQIFFCICCDDTIFYWSHRALHHPAIYKHIHKKHHKFRHTIGIAVEYAHPIEDLMSNTVSTAAGPLILGSHITVFWFYIGLKMWQSIEAHSGYNPPFPISPFSVIDSMDCAPAHDYHHSHNKGNFGGFFIFWDWLMGTDEKYGKFLEKNLKHPAYWNVVRGISAPKRE
jgi:sterol desaturase/sphingolipid hydroxylase (fatty acid hydroxylase superfamily)